MKAGIVFQDCQERYLLRSNTTAGLNLEWWIFSAQLQSLFVGCSVLLVMLGIKHSYFLLMPDTYFPSPLVLIHIFAFLHSKYTRYVDWHANVLQTVVAEIAILCSGCIHTAVCDGFYSLLERLGYSSIFINASSF